MDTTGSMSDDIAAAKARVIEIIQKTNGTISAPLNYVLMPFNDPGTNQCIVLYMMSDCHR